MSSAKRPAPWRIFLAASLVTLGICRPGQAQQRVGDDGRALDANNRVGSGGYNSARSVNPYGTRGNQIVTRNITRGWEFRDRVGYTDPREFRGPVAGQSSERLVRRSGDVRAAAEGSAVEPEPFYGMSRTAAPPPGFVRPGAVPGYVLAEPLQTSAADTRLTPPTDSPIISLPNPGELLLPGPVDPQSQQPTVLSGSPLYGIRQWSIEDPVDHYFLTRHTSLVQGEHLAPAVLDPKTAEQLRSEQTSNNLQTGQGMRSKRLEPEKPSAIHAELRDRYRRSQGDVERNAPAQSPSPAPSTQEPAAPTTAPERRSTVQPLDVNSLADGTDSAALASVLKSAEELMRQGKFTSAIAQYEAAESVAPRNPFIALGRANAELGASYYLRAAGHLRQAFTAEPGLMMGRYNLRDFFSDERISFLVKDLLEIANRSGSESAWFLLAYVAHGTGDDQRASEFLARAEKAGTEDDLYQTLRQHWNLPVATETK